MVEFFTESYWDQVASRLNEHEDFQEDASDLETSLKFVAPDEGRAFIMSVENGKVSAEAVDEDTEAEFSFTGDYDVWVEHHRDGTGLQRLVMSGKLKFDGSMPRIMSLQSQLGFVTDEAREIEAEY